ncbi:signal peptidase I [Clostridium caldaquaticum]|uniref:signal peptidase I n=1 Tax=Clostridium caldaquaticum TaxID=2940653 RepID=UPI00207767CF|nr:signal peptidase I [Clostridium caldaquaticum]
MLSNIKAKCSLLSLFLLFIYFFESTFSGLSLISFELNYVIKMILWGALALAVYFFPRARVHGKLSFRVKLNFLAFNFAVIFIIVSVLFGLIDGFGKSPYSHSLTGISINLLMLISMVIAKEALRSFIINSLAKNTIYKTLLPVSILMALINIPFSKFISLTGYKSIIQFTAQYFLPSFFQSLMSSYIAYLGGALPSIIYMGTIQVFHWVSPVLPNLKWITTALAGILCPMFSLITLQNMYYKEIKMLKTREYSRIDILKGGMISILCIAAVWFASGVFSIYPSVIATGSMKPVIAPGDITINKKVASENLKAGDIVQFKNDNILVSHRITGFVEKDNKIYFKTKGDNNSSEDLELVASEHIRGKVIKVIPKIGWLTLLIKNKDDIPLEKIQF